MLRNIRDDRPSRALPILRRVLAARVVPQQKLTELYLQRETLRLKHVLHTLAIELGFANWESCKRQIDHCPAALLDRYRFDNGAYGDFETNWFPDEATARKWLQTNSGHVVRYGTRPWRFWITRSNRR
ncbi:hypothetical protein QU481_10880 [Crenobacter sp. SG2303]|uniref:Uncharacterized protein n=1 Tax=Crenobacter oryzisoli TaxID=3056844 RepID=A0ABT7XNS8_9NEIS|nr:hypothetical protein [Crenobacter sp. SG2303]MDN0075395.1 hypothetical protein [Crenobacter sp. SG2303]